MQPIGKEWSQEELKQYLLSNGWTEDHFIDGQPIPQGVKYIDFSPLTEAEIASARELIAQHPEWLTLKESKESK